MDSEPFARGEEIPGTPYRYVSVLGRGGQGTVVEVEHTFLGSRAVMKLLNPQHVDRHDLSGRMRDEARALAAIRHPNIVRVTDGGLTGEKQPRPFFVMEKLDGDTLLAILRRRADGLPLRSAIAIAAEILDALDVAHTTHRMIHRDVKPGNVFLARISPVEVRAVLLDFGVARMKKPSAFTGQHSFVGTFQYAAPEQLRGEVSPQSDLYALGLMLFEMLVGRHPFADAQSVPEWVRFQTHRVPPRVDELRPEIPQPISRLVASALAKDPRQRPSTALAFASELRLLRARYIDGPQANGGDAYTEEMAVEQVVALSRGDVTMVPPTAREPERRSNPGSSSLGNAPTASQDSEALGPPILPVPIALPQRPQDPRRATADLPPTTERPAQGLHGTARFDGEIEIPRQTLAMDGAPRAQVERPLPVDPQRASRPNVAAAWGARPPEAPAKAPDESWNPAGDARIGAPTVPAARKASRTGWVFIAIGLTGIVAALAVAAAMLGTHRTPTPLASALTAATPVSAPAAAVSSAPAPVAAPTTPITPAASTAAETTSAVSSTKSVRSEPRPSKMDGKASSESKPPSVPTVCPPPAGDGVPHVQF
jgi:serine/threonine-protein kinase